MVAVEDSDHEIHSMQGDDEDMEDEGTHIYGCLDNVATHKPPHPLKSCDVHKLSLFNLHQSRA